MLYDLIVIGGGAAGFFTAIRYAERMPGRDILILEASKKLLAKVEVSGGGRCNVTHACFIPSDMVRNYPRGEKELLGPFHRFLSGDMMAWLEERGVPVKIEEDGRVFPVTDNSQSIIDCFTGLCKKYAIRIEKGFRVEKITGRAGEWMVSSGDRQETGRQILWATGSSPAAWKVVQRLGHQIITPVPSLFTFNIRDKGLHALAGVSVPSAIVSIPAASLAETGPLLITHWGMSGPAILRLSSVGARTLHEKDYRFTLHINWVGDPVHQVQDWISDRRKGEGGRSILANPYPGISKRLWQYLLISTGLSDKPWADLSRDELQGMITVLTAAKYQVDGKSTFKEEFVTCGGVNTREVDFRTMESKIHPGMYFAGEVLNIDAVTGGFNFQAAWTEGFIAAQAMN